MSDLLAPPGRYYRDYPEYMAQLQRRVRERNAQRHGEDSILRTAQESGDPYMRKLGTVTRRVGELGIDQREFFRSPGAYQFMMEGPPADGKPPDQEGFLDRMGQRFQDGDLLTQRGLLGWQMIRGKMDLEEGRQRAAELRNQMTEGEWVKEQGFFIDKKREAEAQGHDPSLLLRIFAGAPTWLNKQAGAVAELVGQQVRKLPEIAGFTAAGAATGAAAGSIVPGGGHGGRRRGGREGGRRHRRIQNLVADHGGPGVPGFHGTEAGPAGRHRD